ncbi:MAG: hypothetical protein MUF10_15195 [Thermoanaerobaculaceae bacterium]|nr:hypothetical protein [Thermoanaerobaculaceae bacterium]
MAIRVTRGLVVTLAIGLGLAAHSVEGQQEPPVQTAAAVVSPAPWIDRLYDRITRYFNGKVAAADYYFGLRDDIGPFQESQLRFRLWVEHDRYHTRVEPTISADVAIPRIERRFSIYADNVASNVIPGLSPTETKDNLRVGVRGASTHGRRWQFTRDLSVRASGGLVLEALVAAHYQWYWGHWDGHASQSLFWNNQDSLGSLTRLVLDRQLAPAWYLRLQTGAKYTQEREYWTASQVVKVGWVVAENRDYLLGSVAAFSKDQLMDEYRAEMTYRRRVWRPWIFIELTPSLRFERDRDFESNPGVRLGLDLFFGGLPRL